jgi:histidine ammonia-lyase
MASTSPKTGSPAVATLAIGRARLSVADVLDLAHGRVLPALDGDPAYRSKLADARRVLESALRDGQAVYGVTTGVGASVDNAIPDTLRHVLPKNLLRFHGCGVGPILGEVEAAAVVSVRLNSLARGHSGVSVGLLERLCELLRHRLLPRIPAQGSVGASGDLTPLSYLAALLVGEREVTLRGRARLAADALAEVGLAPLELGPKESLALMNGTSVMTALGCLATARARRLARLGAAVTALASVGTHGNPGHFDPRLFDWKPHPGQQEAASWIRLDLEGAPPAPPARLQDRYSLRCAPHALGVLVDAEAFARRTLEIELNGVDDNPLIDPERGDVLHGGNFFGGHVAFVMDALKIALAGAADLFDRQLVLLCSPETSDGLPANLVSGGARGAGVAHHGMKAMQITASALAAEAAKLAMPAGVFSRSTESHNQDKVSLGTIAARDALAMVELAETVAAIGLIAGCQALDLRAPERPPRRLAALHAAVRAEVPMLREDRRQDVDIERVLGLLRAGELPLDEPAAA